MSKSPLPVRLGFYACFLLLAGCMWYSVAYNFEYEALEGQYTYSHNGARCTVRLQADRIFHEELQSQGRTTRASGTWNRSGDATVSFSGTFLPPAEAQRNDNGTTQGTFFRLLGLFPRFRLAPDGSGPLFKRDWF